MSIGPELARFLDDPLRNGQALNLTLPFVDPDLIMAAPGGWLRGNFNNTFHCAIDFESRPAAPNAPQRLFEVAAAADGVVRFLRVISNGQVNEGGIVLQHEVAQGVIFHTLYFHMDKTTIPFSVGDRVKRGQVLGKIVRWMDGLTFLGKADSSHWVVMDTSKTSGGSDGAPTPMEMVLFSLG